MYNNEPAAVPERAPPAPEYAAADLEHALPDPEPLASGKDTARFRPVKSYILRGRRLTPAQNRLLDSPSPFRIPFSPEELDFKAVFGNTNPVFCEIGFGTGEAIARAALDNPGRNYIGIEVWPRGIAALLRKINASGARNIRIISHDAAEVIGKMFPANSVRGFYIFFPDPWPKRKHRKRRLVTRPFTALLASRLENRGSIDFASDCSGYADQALAELSSTASLENALAAFAPPCEYRAQTAFARKALAGNRQIRDLRFIKQPPAAQTPPPIQL